MIQFLKEPKNVLLLSGVIGAGNRNFGNYFCSASKIISQKFKVPLLYCFELLGTEEDIIKIRQGVMKFGKKK